MRQVFATEQDLERLLSDELQNEDSTLAALLDLDVNQVVTQRLNAGLRPDILINVDDQDDQAAVIELTLKRLDLDHLRRTFFYAIENQVKAMLIITPAVDTNISDVLDRYRARLRLPISVLLLRTYVTEHGQPTYYLDPAFPDQDEEDTTGNARQTLLTLVKKRLYKGLQDNSLLHLSVQENGRLEWYPVGGHIRLYAGLTFTSITIKLHDLENVPAVIRHSQMMMDSAEFEDAVSSVISNSADYRISWSDKRRGANVPRLLVQVDYGDGRQVNDLTDDQLDEVVDRIARIVHNLRKAADKHLKQS